MEGFTSMEGSTIIGSQRPMSGSSPPSKASRSPSSDDLTSPVCEVCHWGPDMNAERPFEILSQAVEKHSERNHQSQDYRCKVCNQSFRNRPDNIKPHVRVKHPDMFDPLYTPEASSLNIDSKALQSESDLSKAKQPSRKFVILDGLPGSLTFQSSAGHGSEDFPEQSLKTYPSQRLSAGCKFKWVPGTTQQSDDSGYSSVGQRDDITKPTPGYIHSDPWQRGYYERSFYAVPGGFSLCADDNRTSRASSTEMNCEDAQIDALVRSAAEHGTCQTETGSEAAASTPSTSCRVISPQTNEHSNDGDSSRPTETSTPESSTFWLAEYSEDEEERLENSHPFMDFKASALARLFEEFLSWREKSSGEDTPSDGADTSNNTPIQGQGKAKDSVAGKRKWADRSETSKGITDGSEPSSSQTTSSKRRRTSDRKLTFACPYTKKDPMSYRDCYRYTLSRIRDVKQHLARCHRNPPYCPRCRGTFHTEEERDEHIRDTPCPLRPSIKFEGVTESQRQQLAKKSASNASLEAQWFAVFDILFPGHDPRPQSPYIDSELLQDITLYQDHLMRNGPRVLSDVLTQRGAITWNLPNEERDLAAFQQTIFEEGLRAIFDQWVARRASSREDPNISPSSGTANNLTPSSSDTSVERAGSNSNQPPEVPPHGITSTLPERGPTSTLAGSEAVQETLSDQDPFIENLNGMFNFGQEDLDFHQGIPYNGPDEALMSFMLGNQASSSFQPAPG